MTPTDRRALVRACHRAGVDAVPHEDLLIVGVVLVDVLPALVTLGRVARYLDADERWRELGRYPRGSRWAGAVVADVRRVAP